MNERDAKHAIRDALVVFASGPLAENATRLLNTLGYSSNRTLALSPNSADAFVEVFRDRIPDVRRTRERASMDEWLTVDLLFQLTGDDLSEGGQSVMQFGGSDVGTTIMESYLFFAIHLAKTEYTRTQLSVITREMNRVFPMPVMLLFQHGQSLTLAVIDRRLHKRDGSKDVLEKVTLIKDISAANPHRAHVDVLYDLSLPAIHERKSPSSFQQLHDAWREALDTSELNKRFYTELANWYFWASEHVAFPTGAGDDEEARTATGLIRLLTRLIFVWFVREKGLVPDDLFDRDKLEDIVKWEADDNSTYYKAILQNLFFATLNQENPANRRFRGRRERREDGDFLVHSVYRYEDRFHAPTAALEMFSSVPFLNGGLFECLDHGTEAGLVRVDDFSDRPDNELRIPDFLFFGDETEVDLNKAYGTKGRKHKARGLLHILNAYKFTVTENTPIEQEVALDPELLGQVFENLLAAYNPETGTTARKETGSFYTPRNVVNYMVDESLLAYFHTKLDELFSREDLEADLRILLAYTDEPPPFDPTECELITDAIDELKVLDPACGSGAFPMGVLHKLVYILGKLDPGNRRWKERQLAKVADIDVQEAKEEARKRIERSFQNDQLDYARKLYLIENCIYGVDIQPIAVQIARLRCFVSLVVDENVDEDEDNFGILPLPNLETRFVAANTLIPSPTQGHLGGDSIRELESELTRVRHDHFQARTLSDKRRCRDEDARIRREIRRLMGDAPWVSDADADTITAWDPYSQTESSGFFDPEWMFNVTEGFDVVIGNPPYVRQEKIDKELKPRMKDIYDCYTGVADLYVYFYESGVRFLRAGTGVLTFISSNKYFRANYGAKLREYLGSRLTVRRVIDFGDAPIFKAIAYPSIVMVQNAAPKDNASAVLTWDKEASLDDFEETVAADSFPMPQTALSTDSWRLERPEVLALLGKLRATGTPLSEYVNGRFYRGVLTGLNQAFVIDTATRDRLIAEDPTSAEIIKPFLRGRDVKRWRATSAGLWLIFARRGIDIGRYQAVLKHLSQYRKRLMPGVPGGRKPGSYEWYEIQDTVAYWQEFETPKIIYPDIYQHQSFAFDTSGALGANTCYFIPTDEVWLCGLLNSTCVEWFYALVSAKVRAGYLRAFKDYIAQIPVPDSGNREGLEELVHRISAAKADDPTADVSSLEREIDERVYALYGLSAEEVRLIEHGVETDPPA